MVLWENLFKFGNVSSVIFGTYRPILDSTDYIAWTWVYSGEKETFSQAKTYDDRG